MTQSTLRAGWRGWALGALALLIGGQTVQAQDVLRFPINLRGQFTRQGMVIQAVQAGSPEALAGIERGDVIVKIDGVAITNQLDLVRIVNSSGGALVLHVAKGGAGRLVRINLDLTGGVRPGGVPGPYLLGVLGLYRPEGMLVKVVAPCTPAARIGLQPNDLIVRINNNFIRNQRDLFVVLNNSNGTAVLDVRSARTGRVVRVTADLKLYELGALGDFTPQGMRIRLVSPGTPADRFGLVAGDIIAGIDNQVIRNQRDFDTALRTSGGSVVLAVRKAPRGLLVRLQVDLMNNQLGVWCEPVDDGVRITSVTVGTPAEQLGLARGDVILRVGRRRLRSSRDLVEALKDSGGLATITVRQGRTGRLVRLDAALGW